MQANTWYFFRDVGLKRLIIAEINFKVIQGQLIEHGLTSAPTQYRLYGRRFLQVKKPNQQYQSTKGDDTKDKGQTIR